jgi:hypothetical protein
MAAKKTATADTGAGLAADPGVAMPRISLQEQGFVGLRTTNGAIIEEANRAFRFPQFLKVVSEMRTDPTIGAALNVYRMLLKRPKWSVKPPEKATETEKKRAKALESMMYDLEDGDWSDFISEVSTYLEYGFAIHEKVYRRRLKRNGSKFNDGLVGIRKLAPRGQDTIRHWNFSQDGRQLESVGQSLANMENGARYSNLKDENGLITISRDKFLLFSVDSVKGNPEGKSILKSVYLPYKQLTMLRDQQLLGIAKDLSAIPIVSLPPQYMDPDASPENKAVYKAYQDLVNNVAAGTQRGIVMPTVFDPETKGKLFEFSLLEAKGGSKFDLQDIIKQLQNDIFVALSVDVITKDGSDAGSFSIKDTKTNLCAMAVEHRLSEIRNVLNKDLVAQVYALNGWEQDRLPTFEYGDIADVDSEAFSKLVQRVASVGLVEIDRAVLNKIRDVMGIDLKPEDEEVDKENLTGASSKSGAGMEPGTTGEGTAKIGGKSKKTDKSASNADNAA